VVAGGIERQNESWNDEGHASREKIRRRLSVARSILDEEATHASRNRSEASTERIGPARPNTRERLDDADDFTAKESAARNSLAGRRHLVGMGGSRAKRSERGRLYEKSLD
jgi:hypothetical protein